MGLLQVAYETYENQSQLAGVQVEGKKEMLLPIAHSYQNARIEIELDLEGNFKKAIAVPKADAKTITPATEPAVSRSGSKIAPYPLSDKLEYVAKSDGEKYKAYLAQLEAWAASPYTHPKVKAVLTYIKSGKIMEDLKASGVITDDENGKIETDTYEKCSVRWRVLASDENVPTAAWEDQTLIKKYQQFYKAQQENREQVLCAITGKMDTITTLHPKGIVQTASNAKLVSANDSSGFTFRGRFTEGEEACTVGYNASQKAHSALRWLCVNEGVVLGGRTFICWNPKGRKVPKPPIVRPKREAETEPTPKWNFTSYKSDLLQTLGGYREVLPESDQIVTAALEAATSGRLSATYFNQLKASDFIDRLQNWYQTCCWKSRYYGITSPALATIVECAFGTERDTFIKADNRLMSEHTQQLLPCITESRPIPQDVVRALTVRAGTPQAYSDTNHERVLCTACAVIRKYHNDRLKREEYTLELDYENRNRSYLFGRLLAVLEQVERSTYDRDEGRETNAIRMQTVFAQRPLYAWRILEDKLNPYFGRLTPGLRAYYKNLIGEIVGKLPGDDVKIGASLDDTYLLGYYLQRTAMLTKKKNTNTENADTNEMEEN